MSGKLSDMNSCQKCKWCNKILEKNVNGENKFFVFEYAFNIDQLKQNAKKFLKNKPLINTCAGICYKCFEDQKDFDALEIAQGIEKKKKIKAEKILNNFYVIKEREEREEWELV